VKFKEASPEKDRKFVAPGLRYQKTGFAMLIEVSNTIQGVVEFAFFIIKNKKS
jgi:hypothetical protein